MDVLELNESDEENSPNRENLNNSNEKDADLIDDFESQFPSLDLNVINYIPQNETKQRKENACASMKTPEKSPFKTTVSEKEKPSSVASKRRKSENDSDYESQCDYLAADINNKEINIPISLDDEETGTTKAKGRGRKAAPKAKKVDEEKKRQQEEKQQERLRKKEEAARLKAEKQMHAKNRLVTKADYCMKMMEIIIDNVIQSLDFFTNFLKVVEETEIKYRTKAQVIPRSITWKRTVEDHYINDEHQVCSNTRVVNEDHVLVIWDCEETMKHMANDTFLSEISCMKSRVSCKNLFLVIYKVESYFKYAQKGKDQGIEDEIRNGLGEEKKRYKSKAEKALANLPKVSRKKFEELLIDIQLEDNVTSRIIENEEEMAVLIHQYTRALALLPSKIEKTQDAAKIGLFINSDSRDTVKVDKDGNGLKRLWQQQLCQITLMSLESAEAITSIYKSPFQLMEAYANCSPAEGETLLKDIPIRRAAGPLTSVRRIGPELSKKLFIMFTSKEGDVYLNESG